MGILMQAEIVHKSQVIFSIDHSFNRELNDAKKRKFCFCDVIFFIIAL